MLMQIAQLVEQWTENPCVGGSPGGTPAENSVSAHSSRRNGMKADNKKRMVLYHHFSF